jgi:hypothetical protein
MTTITALVMDESGLRQAIAAATNGDTIYVGTDIHLSAPLTIAPGANLTFAGFSLTIDGRPNDGIDGSIIVDPGATLTVKNMLLTNDVDDGASASDPGADALGAVQNHGTLMRSAASSMTGRSKPLARPFFTMIPQRRGRAEEAALSAPMG